MHGRCSTRVSNARRACTQRILLFGVLLSDDGCGYPAAFRFRVHSPQPAWPPQNPSNKRVGARFRCTAHTMYRRRENSVGVTFSTFSKVRGTTHQMVAP